MALARHGSTEEAETEAEVEADSSPRLKLSRPPSCLRSASWPGGPAFPTRRCSRPLNDYNFGRQIRLWRLPPTSSGEKKSATRTGREQTKSGSPSTYAPSILEKKISRAGRCPRPDKLYIATQNIHTAQNTRSLCKAASKAASNALHCLVVWAIIFKLT